MEVENKLEALKIEVRQEIKCIIDKSDNRENPLQLFHESDVIQMCAAMPNMALLKMILDFLPDPSGKLKALNGFDRFGRTPLMAAAGAASFIGLQECRQTMKDLIDLGADRNVVETWTGLSALGLFREDRQHANIPLILFGFQGTSADINEEDSGIEELLTPENGPTLADNALLDEDSDDSSL